VLLLYPALNVFANSPWPLLWMMVTITVFCRALVGQLEFPSVMALITNSVEVEMMAKFGCTVSCIRSDIRRRDVCVVGVHVAAVPFQSFLCIYRYVRVCVTVILVLSTIEAFIGYSKTCCDGDACYFRVNLNEGNTRYAWRDSHSNITERAVGDTEMIARLIFSTRVSD
jgi:hypothetical protein